MTHSLSSLTVTAFCDQAVETAALEVAMEPALADTAAAAVTLVDMEAAMAATEVEMAAASEVELEADSEVEMTVSIIYAPLQI